MQISRQISEAMKKSIPQRTIEKMNAFFILVEKHKNQMLNGKMSIKTLCAASPNIPKKKNDEEFSAVVKLDRLIAMER
jgi:hypothetical protein